MIKIISVIMATLMATSCCSLRKDQPGTLEPVRPSFCNLSAEDFDLVSRTIEAESDRSDNFEGRVLIAEVIFNRVNDSNFPDSARAVCEQSGQFQVVYEGTIWSVGRTKLSDEAIIEALCRIDQGQAPNVMYFNNSGYAYGTPYCYEGGNYFVTVP